MIKKVSLIAMASLSIVSCSHEEDVTVSDGTVIDFRAAVGSRATEVTAATDLDAIYVTAIHDGSNFFDDVPFKRKDTSFESDVNYYWPTDGNGLTFYAYAPDATKLGGTKSINSTGFTIAGFVPDAKISLQQDFVAATATAAGTDANISAGVALTFKHQLSQIEILAKNSNDTYQLKVYGVRIAHPVSKGDYTYGDVPSWTPGTDKAVYTIKYTEPVNVIADAQSIMNGKGGAMLIPQSLTAWAVDTDKPNAGKGAYIGVLVNVTTKDGTPVYPKTAAEEGKVTYDWVAVPVSTEWEAGSKYVYTLDFTNGYGYVAPREPIGTGEGGDGEEGDDGEKKGDDNDPNLPKEEDRPTPGDKVTGNPIKFTVTVGSWTDASQNVNM